MATEYNVQNSYTLIRTAVIIAIILGMATSVFFLVINKDSYSAIYILPDSVIQIPGDNAVLYAYGITSSETKKTEYTLDTYIGNELVKSRQFSLNTGETLEERVKTILPPGVQYPEKITLTLNTGSKNESVHFWLNDQVL